MSRRDPFELTLDEEMEEKVQQFMLDADVMAKPMQDHLTELALDIRNKKKELENGEDDNQCGAVAVSNDQNEWARISSLKCDLEKVSNTLNDLLLKQKPILKEINENVQEMKALKAQMLELNSSGNALLNTVRHLDIKMLQMSYDTVEYMRNKILELHAESLKLKNKPPQLINPFENAEFLNVLCIESKQEVLQKMGSNLQGIMKKLMKFVKNGDDALKQIANLQERQVVEQIAVYGADDPIQ